MNVSEYIVNKLVKWGVKHIFMVVGGGAMYLNDAVIKNKKIKYICPHHEQAGTMMAEGYSRITGNIGVVMVTSGAGMTNTLTGVLGAWWDSIPLFIISGNAKTEHLTYKRPTLRQLGVQDTRIIDIVKPITKYAKCVYNPQTIDYKLDKAYYLAKSDRPGPVWLDIPLDVQSTKISKLYKFKPNKKPQTNLKDTVKKVLNKLKSSKYPAIVVGSGIRLNGSYDLFHKVLNKLNIPVLTTLTAQDIMWESHPLYGGRFGAYGNEKGNKLVNAADFLLILSSRLYLWQIGYGFNTWAKQAYKVMVDIDQEELDKPTMRTDLKIRSDVKEFLIEMDKQL